MSKVFNFALQAAFIVEFAVLPPVFITSLVGSAIANNNRDTTLHELGATLVGSLITTFPIAFIIGLYHSRDRLDQRQDIHLEDVCTWLLYLSIPCLSGVYGQLVLHGGSTDSVSFSKIAMDNAIGTAFFASPAALYYTACGVNKAANLSYGFFSSNKSTITRTDSKDSDLNANSTLDLKMV